MIDDKYVIKFFMEILGRDMFISRGAGDAYCKDIDQDVDEQPAFSWTFKDGNDRDYHYQLDRSFVGWCKSQEIAPF